MKIGTATSLLLCTLTVGCATPKQVADQTVNMSLAIEDANNRMMLLNVVRAYNRMPMQFFRVNKVAGPAGVGSVTQGFTPALNGLFNAATAFTLASSYKPDQPAFDITPLDSQEFYQGITKPIDPKLFGYYLSQGWPRQLLFYMFVREIEKITTKSDGSTESVKIQNFPQSEVHMKEFQEFADSLLGCDVHIEEEKQLAKFGPSLKIHSHHPVEKLAAAKVNGLSLVEDGEFFQLAVISRASTLKVSRRTPSGATCKFLQELTDGETQPSSRSMALKSHNDEGAATSKSSVAYKLSLRSPEAMIYYLGEISRAQLDGTYSDSVGGRPRPPTQIRFERPRRPETDYLFVLQKDDTHATWIAINYDGATYSVPRRGSGRSTHVLSLMTQMIGLQNKVTEAPVTGSVRLAN